MRVRVRMRMRVRVRVRVGVRVRVRVRVGVRVRRALAHLAREARGEVPEDDEPRVRLVGHSREHRGGQRARWRQRRLAVTAQLALHTRLVRVRVSVRY